MAGEQVLHRRSQALRIERPFQIQYHLDDVRVETRCIVLRVEHESFLQRRQRQDVGRARQRRLDELNLGLLQIG